jgi:hypothetical protein
MPNKRIDQLPASDNQVQGTDKIPVFSDGRTERITIDELGSYISSNSDTYVTGGTYTNGTLTLSRNDGVDLTINGFFTGNTSDVKVYRALLTQTGTTAPVATILENTLGFTPVYGYTDVGQYTLTQLGGFPLDKTIIDCSRGYSNFFGGIVLSEQKMSVVAFDADTIYISTVVGTSATDGLMDAGTYINAWIEIKVYP